MLRQLFLPCLPFISLLLMFLFNSASSTGDFLLVYYPVSSNTWIVLCSPSILPSRRPPGLSGGGGGGGGRAVSWVLARGQRECGDLTAAAFLFSFFAFLVFISQSQFAFSVVLYWFQVSGIVIRQSCASQCPRVSSVPPGTTCSYRRGSVP